jgi:hypothetical protein
VSFCTVFLADDSERVVPGVFGRFNLLEEMGWSVFLVANFEGAETGVFGIGRGGTERGWLVGKSGSDQCRGAGQFGRGCLVRYRDVGLVRLGGGNGFLVVVFVGSRLVSAAVFVVFVLFLFVFTVVGIGVGGGFIVGGGGFFGG